MDMLIETRNTLAIDLAFCDGEAFPGSAARRKYNAALAALAAFDRAHPGVLAAIRGEMSDGVARALRGED